MTTRRQFLVVAAGIGLAAGANATPESMREAMRKVTGGALLRQGRVKLDLPALIDNGNAVALGVTVESPMTPGDHVKAIHVFNEKNPLPGVISVFLGPRSGRAHLQTRVRLADSQTVTAIAQLSDGSFWSHSVQVTVTLAACAEES
jgi:sulfur-oxidizing protein SoxY